MKDPIKGNDDNQPDDSEATTTGTEGEPSGEKTFTQEEVDTLISKRIGEIKAKNEKAQAEAIQKALEEHDRQAQLSEEEKASEQLEKQKAELEGRTRELAIRENRIEAREILQEKGISAELADWVVRENADETKENIQKLEKVFNPAVEEAVTKRMSGKTPSSPEKPKSNGEKKSTRDLLFG